MVAGLGRGVCSRPDLRGRPMPDRLIEFLRARMALSREHEQLVRGLVTERRVKKGVTLQRGGERATQGYFVSAGLLRSFWIDEDGREHVLQFAPEDWWITEFPSLRDGKPATYFVEALEDSDVVFMPLEAHTRWSEVIPGYSSGFAAGLLKMHAAREKRLLDSLSATAEQRYLNFMDAYGSIARRVPQHMLASYLGLTPETLSRLRGSLARKKRARPGAV